MIHKRCCMARHIDLSLLRAFVMVFQSGGMTRAGQQLNLTQAAVSQQIRRLEEQFDLELFDRSQKQIKLSPHGERLLPQAQKVLAMNDEIWGLMTTPEFEGEIRLGVPYDIVHPYIAPVLRHFNESWPRISIKLASDTTVRLLKMLEVGEIDLTLTTEAKSKRNRDRLLTDQLVWVGAPAGKAYMKEPVPLSLDDETCVFRAAAIESLSKRNRNWTFTASAVGMAPQFAMLEADMAVAPMLSRAVPDFLEILGPESGLPPLPLYFINLYVRKTGVNELILELEDHIRKHFSLLTQQAALA